MFQQSATQPSRNEPQGPGASSRRTFLRKASVMTLAAGGAAAFLGAGKPARGATDFPDMERLMFFFRSIQDHENDHVDALLTALGDDARPKPTFHNLVQPTLEAFIATSQALENTGVGAYLGALPAILSREYLSSAGSIALIEARHAGFLNVLENDPITGNSTDLTANVSFEDPLSYKEVLAAAAPFIRDLNGGPSLAFSRTRSEENDIAILNYALALEYLESEFYNINVRRFDFGS